MLIDAQALDEETELRSDVTVVGAGPAGIVVALELARRGHGVVLAESGRRQFSAEIQRLGDAAHFDPSIHAPMSEATRRQIGGASVIWGGRCLPYDRVDFDERPWIPHSSWPVGYEEIRPYFDRAARWFFCGEADFDIRSVPRVEQRSIVPGLPDGEVLTSTLERWSLPTNFGKEYFRELRSSGSLRLVYGLTCTEILCDESGCRVKEIRGRTVGGRTARLRSRVYVLACGGLESTRLLLSSDRIHPGGIGNHSGLLGRYYMGHVSGRIARVRFSTPPERTVFAFDRDHDGVYVRRRFSFSREFLHQKGLPNIEASLVNPDIWDPSHGNGILSFAYLALTAPFLGKHLASEAIRKAATGKLPERVVWPHVWNMVRDLPTTLKFIGSFGYKRFLAWRKIPGFFVYSASNSYPLHYHAEQVPNPESRVTLSDERDGVGMRRLHIELRFSPQDAHGVARAHRFWDEYLRRHRCGQLEYLAKDLEESVSEQARDGFHQVGTTRMSTRPENGVVDPHGQVHGCEGLYVASSSNFVTSSQANPTFMVVAFSLRLADRLCDTVLRGGSGREWIGRPERSAS